MLWFRQGQQKLSKLPSQKLHTRDTEFKTNSLAVQLSSKCVHFGQNESKDEKMSRNILFLS